MHNKLSIRSIMLQAIEAYCRTHGMTETGFGRRVVNDSHFVERLREGKARLATLETAEQFMAANPNSEYANR